MIVEKIISEKDKKRELLGDLNTQVNIKTHIKSSKFKNERRNDLHNLDVCQSTFLAEERAIQSKILKEK
jgi:hypothetical protein